MLAREVRDPGAAGADRHPRGDDRRPRRRARVRATARRDGDDEDARAPLAALGRASMLLRREVTQRLGLRYAPELRFFYDDGLDTVTRDRTAARRSEAGEVDA